jgi:hypothetical protein
MADNTIALDTLITKLRRSKAFVQAAAPAAAKAMGDALKETVSAGETPDGTPWVPKKDGGAPLVNAASKITVKSVGTVLVAVIPKIEAIHNQGTRRIPARQILPKGGIPPAIAAAIKQSIIAAWEASK